MTSQAKVIFKVLSLAVHVKSVYRVLLTHSKSRRVEKQSNKHLVTRPEHEEISSLTIRALMNNSELALTQARDSVSAFHYAPLDRKRAHENWLL